MRNAASPSSVDHPFGKFLFDKPFELLIAVLFLNATTITLFGRIPGSLPFLSACCGLLLAVATLHGFIYLAQWIDRDLGRRWRIAWGIMIAVQVFWAYFRAPLDVDGLFYHLTIILEALQKGHWGDWDYPNWSVQARTKFAEINNLCFISLGGYRFAQFGHFTSALMGALAFERIASLSRWKKPALLALVFSCTPIVVKQMSANYDDLALWSAWAACFAFLASRQWMFAAIAGFLVCGTKMNGPLLILTLFPLAVFEWKNEKRFPWKPILLLGVFSFLGTASWTVPNFFKYGNPVYPLNLQGLLPGSHVSVLPADVPVHHLHGFANTLGFSAGVTWFLNLFLIEPVPVYDMAGGAWGLLVIWALVSLFFLKGFLKPEHRIAFLFTISILLAFIVVPGRFMPRYSMLAGFLFLIPALFLYDQDLLPKKMRFLFSFFFVLQNLYVLPDRALVRGVQASSIPDALQVVRENFLDIVRDGEPQAPDRWMHFPYVRELRSVTGQTVTIGKGCVDLGALYWGRKFDNHVVWTAECCRWPDCK